MIYKCLDISKPVIVTFLGLGKAFDTVNHKILLDKLYCYGGSPIDLLNSYIYNRMQKVRI